MDIVCGYLEEMFTRLAEKRGKEKRVAYIQESH